MADATLTFTVPGASCDHCRAAISAEIAKVHGVRSVEVDLAGKTVTVTGNGVDESAVVAAIDDAGYDVAA